MLSAAFFYQPLSLEAYFHLSQAGTAFGTWVVLLRSLLPFLALGGLEHYSSALDFSCSVKQQFLQQITSQHQA